jgi:hypothetical protein
MRTLYLQSGQPLYLVNAFNSSLVMLKSSCHDNGSGLSQNSFSGDIEVEGALAVDGVEEFLTIEPAVQDDESSTEESEVKLRVSLSERGELEAEVRRSWLSYVG